MRLVFGLDSNPIRRWPGLRLSRPPQSPLLAAVWVCLVGAALARPALARPALADTEVPTAPAADALEACVQQALASNSALQAQDFAVEAALEALAAARARHAPVLSLNARYTVSDGGRTIEIPTGDLVNPVYRSLNQLTAGSATPTQFPEIANSEIRFLRPHEQDSRLNLVAPLYAPQISAEIRLRDAQLDGSRAAREAYARTLVRDVKAAYFRLASARAGLRILEASRTALAENLRVATALVDAGKATRDHRLRAEAELLAIEQRLRSAASDERAARRYLNVLRNRDEAEDVAIAGDAGEETPGVVAAGIARPRPELRGLDAQIDAAEQARALAHAAYRPTLSLVADGGIQGSGYRVDSGARVGTASLVLSWTLFDFGTRRAAVAQSAAQAAQLRALRADAARQLDLLRANAQDAAGTAEAGLATAAARRRAAEEAFRIAERKRDAGQLSQVEFIDAERSLTEARLGQVIARSDWQLAQAEIEYTQSAYPLPNVAGSTP